MRGLFIFIFDPPFESRFFRFELTEQIPFVLYLRGQLIDSDLDLLFLSDVGRVVFVETFRIYSLDKSQIRSKYVCSNHNVQSIIRSSTNIL